MRFYFRVAAFSLAASFILFSSLYADDLAQLIENHMNSAASYEKRAAELDRVIDEHMRMKTDDKNEQVISTDDLQEMKRHCDAIVRDANALKSNFLALAEWHKLLASDLKQTSADKTKAASEEAAR